MRSRRRALSFLTAIGILLVFPAVASAQCPPGTPEITLTDGGGGVWDINNAGAIIEGSGAFDYGMMLKVNGSYFPAQPSITTEVSGRQLVLGPAVMSGLNVTRKVFVPQDRPWARFVEIFENPTAFPVTVPVRIETNLASDAETLVRDSSGESDTYFTTAERWVVTDDASDGGGTPAFAFNLYGRHAATEPSMVGTTVFSCNGTQGLFVEFNIHIPAQSTRALMHFGAQHSGRALASAGARARDLATSLTGLTAADASVIVNWHADACTTLAGCVEDAEPQVLELLRGPVGPQGPEGSTGAQGPAGPAGPQGPAGSGFASPTTHTIPAGGLVTVSDTNVTASSVIVLQYIGTATKSGKVELSVVSVAAGQFTAQGAEGRQFRYVVFN